MPNPMTGAGYGKPAPTPQPVKPNPKAPKVPSRKKVKMGNVTTYEGSLYQKRQEAFLKKMREMDKLNYPNKGGN